MSAITSIAILALGSRAGGPATFLKALVPRLARLQPQVEMHIFLPAALADELRACPPNVELHACDEKDLLNPVRRAYLENVSLPMKLKQMGISYCLVSGEIFGPFIALSGIPCVNIYHATLQFYIRKTSAASGLRLMYTRLMRDVCMKVATRTVAISQFARGELGGRYPHRMLTGIEVIQHGVDGERFFPLESPIRRFSFPYILALGDRHRHKNYARMISVFASTRARCRVDQHLVIVGRPIDASVEAELGDICLREGLSDVVHFVDGVDSDMALQLYNGASLYLTTSSFETFGMTPLEAMACGCAVMLPADTAFPEVYGSAGIFFDPASNDDAIADQLVQVLGDEILLSESRKRGLALAQRMTWEACAARYAALMSEVMR